MALDYRNFQTLPKASARYPFEDLVCHIARRICKEHGGEFQKIEGSGGDGGVECKATMPDGTVIGYQAKFFPQLGDKQWTQIEESIETCLRKHKDVTEIRVCIPRELTMVVSKGKSQTEKWHDLKAKIFGKPEFQGNSTSLVIWTNGKLEDELTQEYCQGLRALYFGDLEFSRSTLRGHLDSAIVGLDERYNQDHHVDIRLQEIVNGAMSHHSVLDAVRTKTRELVRFREPVIKSDYAGPSIDYSPVATQIKKIHETVKRCETALTLNLERLREETSKLATMAWDLAHKVREDSNVIRTSFDHPYYEFSRQASAIAKFANELSEPQSQACDASTILLYGEAGIGKSHLMGAMAVQCHNQEGIAFIALGSELSGAEDLKSALAKQFAPGKEWPEFLNALDAEAERQNTRAVLMIDAVNEIGSFTRLRPSIARLVAEVGRLSNVSLILSCRDVYLNGCFENSVLQDMLSFELPGFNAEELQLAFQKYLGNYGISEPLDPSFESDFENPLILRIVSNWLRDQGKTEFPLGATGTTAIGKMYLQSMGRQLSDKLGNQVPDTDLIRGVQSLCRSMADKRVQALDRNDARQILLNQIGATPSGDGWESVYHSSGILRIDPVYGSGDDFAPEEIVWLMFQRLQDHLIARQLLSGVNCKEELKHKLNSDFSFLFDKQGFAPNWLGVIGAIWVLAAEKFSVELSDVVSQAGTKLSVWTLIGPFEESLGWRAWNSYSDRTIELFSKLIGHEDQIKMRIRYSIPYHPLGVETTHGWLSKLTMVERDRNWTYILNDISKSKFSEPWRLINWCDRFSPKQDETDYTINALTSLAWLCTSSNHELRDRSTKSMARLIMLMPETGPLLLQKFGGVDDPYVLERVMAALHGACLLDPNSSRLSSYADAVRDEIFAKDQPIPNILVDDFARAIGNNGAKLDHGSAVKVSVRPV